MNLSDFDAAIRATFRPRETREDVVDYFQKKYPGTHIDKRGKVTYDWKSELVTALQPFTRGRLGLMQSRASVARRFQKRGEQEYHETSPSAKQQEEYRALGATLPGIPPDAIRISGTICIRYQDDPCEEREVDELFEGDDLDFLLQTVEPMQSIVNLYMEGPADYGLAGRPNEWISLIACECGTDCECNLEIEADEGEGPAGPINKGYSTKVTHPATRVVKGPRIKKAPRPTRVTRKGVPIYEGPPALTPDQVTEMFQT